MKISTIPALTAGALWLFGCADGNYRPYVLDDSFGQANKQLVKAQIANPEAAANPPAESPKRMDGYAGVNTLDSYRQGFSQIQQPQGLTINIGGAADSGSSGQ
jgi:hypothetical protein